MKTGKTMLRFNTILILFLLNHCASALDDFNLDRVGNALFSPIINDVEIRGDYAYCAESYGLSVWDISDPEDLFKVSYCRIPGGPTRLCINGDYAYASVIGRGVVVVDISDLESPDVINLVEVDIIRVFLDHPLPHISTHDGLLYICGGLAGFYIASLENPTEPEIIAHYHYGGYLNFHTEILCTENAAYLLSNDLYVLNIDDPANVEILNTIDVRVGLDMVIDESRLGIVNGRDVSFISLDNPFEPELVSVFEGHSARAVEINGDYAYGDQRGYFRVYNISDLAEPEFTSEIRGIVGGESITYRDGIIFGAASGNGIMAISVEDPENPALLNDPLPWHVIKEFIVADSLAYVLDAGLGILQILDIANPDDPAIIGEFDEVGTGYQTIDILNEYVYYLNRNGTYIIDVSDPTEPELAGRVRYPHQVLFNKTEIIDGYIFVTGSYPLNGRTKSLLVWDISDPLNPELTFSAENGGGYGLTYHADNYLYQTNNRPDEMLIYSLGDPAEPELVAHWEDWQGGPFFVYNSILYISMGNRFYMYSVEDPSEPENLGSVEFHYQMVSATVEGEIAYLVGYNFTGVICLSLEDPYNPEIVGYYNTPGNIQKVIPHNEHIFASSVIELGIYQLNYEIGDNADFMITLGEGWNLISSPFTPENCNMESIFGRLAARENVIIVKDYLGRFYLPGRYNNIPFWDVNQGYQIKMNQADRLWITGEEVAVDRAIPLPEGWSMAAYFPESDIPAPIAFERIEEALILAKDNLGNFYNPEWDYSNMGELSRGKGYQVKTSEEVELVWNVEEDEIQASQSVVLPNPSHFVSIGPTDRNMSVLILDSCVSISSLEVGAFNKAGSCFGSARLTGEGPWGFAIWGNDSTSEYIDGFKEGEAIEFRYWDGNSEGVLDWEFIEGEAIYSTNSLVIATRTDINGLPSKFKLYPAFPNPFNSVVQLSYSIPRNGHVSLKVFDISGRLINTLINQSQSVGNHVIQWNAESLTSGIYLAKMDASGETHIQKLTLLK